MFELEHLSGSKREEIALETREGTEIKNKIGPDITQEHHNRFRAIINKHGQNWTVRKGPTSGYNCAGHVWASRRTCIYEPDEWRKIICEDGYTETVSPYPDDLVVYFDDNDDIIHVGRVLRVDTMTGGTDPLPWVVSKLQDWTGELIHRVQDVPYESQGISFSFRYLTDRDSVSR